MRIDSSLRVGDVMTVELLTVEPDESLAAADDLMRHGRVRHALVVDDDGSLVGVVSQRDLFHGALLKALGYDSNAKRRAIEELRVKDAMTSEVRTTTPDMLLRDAARLMAKEKLACLPVLEGRRLVGIITEADFVLLVARTGDDANG